MNRFARSKSPTNYPPHRRGFTLVEILVATTLSLIILAAVVQLFAKISTTITQSRSIMEAAERLRSVQNRLQADLEGVTVTPMPPRRPDNSEGYLEILEGPMMLGTTQNNSGAFSIDYASNPNKPAFVFPERPVVTDKPATPYPQDTTVGDVDDVLMVTTRSTGKPFTGKFMNNIVESDVAEVAYFVRGNTLYRRQLLVAPQLFLSLGSVPSAIGFYANNDISVRLGAGNTAVPNTLSDLTRRECRYGHPLASMTYDIREWKSLRLPTSKETSDPDFIAGNWDTTYVGPQSPTPNVMDLFYNKRSDLSNLIGSVRYPMFDFWSTDPTTRLTDSEIIKNPSVSPPPRYQGSTVADDVVLTNVIGFDVRVWDPGYPILQEILPGNKPGNVLKPSDLEKYILPGDPRYQVNLPYEVIGFGGYVDLGYYPRYDYTGWGTKALPCPPPKPSFHHYGTNPNYLLGSCLTARVYDTWSNTYDLYQVSPGNFVQTNDGFDSGGMVSGSIVDSDFERTFSTPYNAPIRGIQVIIRMFEPDSRQIREVTVEQDFLPK